MEDTLWQILGDFVLVSATIDYGTTFLKILAKIFRKGYEVFKKHKSPRRRRLK